MNNSYDYCTQCAIKVPRIFSDVHKKQCHNKLRQHACDKLHPLIKDGEMVSQITVIRDSDTNVTGKLGNWLEFDEPKFMENFNYDFTEKFVFFNELDLYHSHIESFTHVCIQVDSLQAVFVAVSENSDKQQVGTIRFYEKGLKQHFPIPGKFSFVTVKKINRIMEAKKVKLFCSSFVDEAFIRYRFQKKYHTNFEYGFPYLFRKNGEIVTMESLVEDELKVNVEIEEIDLLSESMCYNNFTPMEDITLNITTDSLKNLSFIVNENVESVDISPENSVEHSSHEKTFRSSTPTCEKRLSLTKSNVRKSRKRGNSLLSSSYLSETDRSPVYYWLSKETKIEIVIESNGERTYSGDTKLENLQSHCHNFYKTKDFYLLKDLIKKKLEMKPESKIPNMSWSGLLLLGLPGTGKTATVEELSKDMNLPLITVNILEYTKSGRSENYIYDSFTKAQNCAPSVIFFDGFDCFAHKSQKKFPDKILKALKNSKLLAKPVIFIGATNRPDLVSASMRQSGRFDKDLVLSLPDAETRANILLQILNDQNCDISKEVAITLGKSSLGFSPADIDLSVRTAWQKAIRELKLKKINEETIRDLCLQRKHLEEAVKDVVPSHLRDKYFSISKVHWQDIWGYEKIKERLKKLTKLLSTEKCSKGILFYGPPGCSKTMMARALATETQFSFFPIKCSDLLSKYVGETEKALCDRMEKANLSSPSLVFIDEIDSLCGKQDGGGGTENSVVPELLSQIRKSYNTGNILFVGATNRPHVLDETLLSAGYFELLFHVDLPNCESRCTIWNGLLQGVPHQNICIETLCERTEGFSCAEICNIYQKAAYSLIEAKVSGLGKSDGEVALEDLKLTEELILDILASKSPRTSKSVIESIRAFSAARGS